MSYVIFWVAVLVVALLTWRVFPLVTRGVKQLLVVVAVAGAVLGWVFPDVATGTIVIPIGRRIISAVGYAGSFLGMVLAAVGLKRLRGRYGERFKGRFLEMEQIIAPWFGLVACLVPMLVGVAVLGWQVYHWLYTGDWTSRSILDVVRWAAMSAEMSNEWIQNPASWLGLWKLLNWLPLSGTTIVIGFTILAVFAFDRSHPI